MISRCTNPKDKLYPYYGGRGIRVHRSWLRSFTAFLAAVGKRPHPTYTLERKKNSLGYQPGNVVWASKTAQARNRRSNRMITIGGETRCLAAWAELSGIPYKLVHCRLNKHGWSAERAIFEPKRGT